MNGDVTGVWRAYLRQSKFDPDSYSLDTQRQEIERYAAAHGIEIAEWFTDRMSGKRDDRTDYQRLLDAIRAGDGVLIWRMDRIGRGFLELARLFDDFEKRKVTVVSVTQPELASRFVRNILIALADYESIQLAERVIPNMENAQSQGKWVSRVPKWYRMGEDGRLVPAADAEDAQRCWEMVLQHRHLAPAAAAFDLRLDTLRDMLTNRAYRGDNVWRGTTVANAHPAIVQPETWDAAYAFVTGRRWHKRRIRQGVALLSGYLYVEDTPHRMYIKQQRHQTVKHAYYWWRGNPHKPWTTEKPMHSIRADYAEEKVIGWLRGLSIPDQLAADAALAAVAMMRPQVDAAARDRLERDLADLRAEMVNTTRLFSRGRIDDATFDAAREEQEREEGRIVAMLDAMPRPEDDPLRAAAHAINLRVGLDQQIDAAVQAGRTDALRPLVEEYVTRINVYGAAVVGLAGAQARHRELHPPSMILYANPEAGTETDGEPVYPL